ncbi:unnamed protein product [Parascedosporium putredinis]|uniref:Uncharacterized protein n=1 Tax=Parascedosporium putredinis TaxID=1442378 RepID=A0A9P1HA95_9PEZI|nr:unnamed protein product [Parascedosporium putredinis]CAI8001556.1 unnamed protein product [Parascedosporium putredinis]
MVWVYGDIHDEGNRALGGWLLGLVRRGSTGAEHVVPGTLEAGHALAELPENLDEAVDFGGLGSLVLEDDAADGVKGLEGEVGAGARGVASAEAEAEAAGAAGAGVPGEEVSSLLHATR